MKTISSFCRDTKGNIAILFALVLIPVVTLIGVSLDYSRGSGVQTKLQAALDAAALAANRRMGELNATELEAYALSVANANIGGEFEVTFTDFVADPSTHSLKINGTTNVPTSTLNLVGIDSLDIVGSAKTIIGNQTFDIALVLDNSGSMAGAPLAALKTAATGMTDALFGGLTVHPNVSIGVVPFAGAVNVGPDNLGKNWLDKNAKSSIHQDNLPHNKSNRFDIFESLRNASWGGCVEARPYPLDTNDTKPTSSDKDTRFVPMFAPDEPDDDDSYTNSYVDDDADVPDSASNADRLRIEKYYDRDADIRLEFGSRTGPNYLCDSQPISKLTNRKSKITQSLEAMDAYGGTNMHMGLAWGWRVLSPQKPFTQGRPEGTENHHRLIILMSDGKNFALGRNVPEKSWYSVYGYARDGRLLDSNNTDELVGAINDRTSETCENAKAAGIEIMTIGIGINDDTTLDLLRACASSNLNYFEGTSHQDLEKFFVEIAERLNLLRISE